MTVKAKTINQCQWCWRPWFV